jgi:ABC-2 type transport system ATP-binding protein
VDQGTTDARHQFGYLPEEPRMYGWMRGREYLVFIGRLAGLAGAESGRRADEMLELTGLREAGRRRVAGYSRGMRQRLGLAQTLVTRPPVILLDEPTSALDPVGRRDVLELVVSLKGTVTVFLSTHILSDVDRICDEVAVLDRGRLITQAGRHELMERYTLPIFEVEFADDGGRDSEVQAAELAGLAWVERVDTSGTRWRVWAAEPEQAKHELPRWLVGTGRTLLRYELTRPNLEDVFVRLVGQSSHPHQVVRVAPDSVVPPSV